MPPMLILYIDLVKHFYRAAVLWIIETRATEDRLTEK